MIKRGYDLGDDGNVDNSDRSSVACAWKECRRRVHPSELFCSNGCRNKTLAWNKLSAVHHMAMKKAKPNSFYLNHARKLDLPYMEGVTNLRKYKVDQHKRAWEQGFGSIFERHRRKKGGPKRR